MSSKKKISTEDDRLDSDDDEDPTTERVSKVTKTDMVQPPSLLMDRLLAEKLDKLRLNRSKEKIKFVPNRPRQRYAESSKQGIKKEALGRLGARPRDSIIDRLNSKYDTLVPELSRSKPTVKLINIVSTKESMELASAQAKKQMERQLELNSVSGNRQIKQNKAILKKFQFNDGYEMPSSRMEEPSSSVQPSTNLDEFDSQGRQYLNTDIDKPYRATYASVTSENLRSRVAGRKAEILRKIQLHNQELKAEKLADDKKLNIAICEDMDTECKDSQVKSTKGRGKNVRFEDTIQEGDDHKRHTPQINEEPKDIKPIIKKDQEIDMDFTSIDKSQVLDFFTMGSDDEISDDDGRLD